MPNSNNMGKQEFTLFDVYFPNILFLNHFFFKFSVQLKRSNYFRHGLYRALRQSLIFEINAIPMQHTTMIVLIKEFSTEKISVFNQQFVDEIFIYGASVGLFISTE